MADLRRSLAYSAAGSYLGVAIQLATTVVLSRLLTPAEVGIFAVAAVFTSLAATFRDFGVAEYLIQAENITPQQIRAAFAMNLAVSWFIAMVIFVGSGPTGHFYNSPGVGEVMRVQAMNFVLLPFGAITMGWFRRQMTFKPYFVVSASASVTYFVVALTCALHGMGYMSLAWSSFASVCATVLTSVLLRPRELPRWPSLKGIAEVLRFGTFASGIYIFGQLGKGAPEMVIGRALNMASVAMFSRANGLVELFHRLVVRAVMPVCLPYFARAVREEGSVVRGYLLGVSYLTVIGWPCLGFFALAAFPAIRIIYGDQWGDAVPLASLLCVAAAIDLVHFMAKEALMSQGRVELGTRLQVIQQSARVLGLLAVIPFGLVGSCWGLLAASAAGLAISQWHLRTGVGLGLLHLWRACRVSLAVTAVSLAPTGALALLMPAGEHNFVRFGAVAAAASLACWLLAMRWFSHPLLDELVALAGKLPLRRRTDPPQPIPPA